MIAAGVGGIRRARWSAIGSAVAAVSFGGMLLSMGWPAMFLAQNAFAVVCAALSSVLAWRSTRPLLGSARDVLA